MLLMNWRCKYLFAQLPPATVINIDGRAINDTHGEILETHKQGRVKSFFSSSVDKEKIRGWTTSLCDALKRFEVCWLVLVL